MTMFNEQVLRETKDVLKGLEAPLRMTAFSREVDCGHCSQALSFAEEFAAVDDRLKLEKKDLGKDREEAERLGIHDAPALVVENPRDGSFPVRYYRLPGGYEFGAFLRVLVLLSSGKPAECLTRLKRSSWKAATSLPSATRAAEASRYPALIPRISMAAAS